MFFHMYIAAGRGRQHTGDKILLTTQRPFLFAHMLQVSKWSLRNLILYTFFNDMYIAPGQGHKTHWINFWCQQKALITLPIRCKFKKRNLILYTNDFIYVYSPGARADNPLGTNFWCQQKALITLSICCRFKKNCFEGFCIHFFSCFTICI